MARPFRRSTIKNQNMQQCNILLLAIFIEMDYHITTLLYLVFILHIAKYYLTNRKCIPEQQTIRGNEVVQMNDAEGYDVLRLIEHSKSCYVSSEYVRGTPLIRWLKYHPNLSKEQLFFWIHEMAGQLERIHKCRGRPCYRYVNPYSIIITEEKELYFLDTSAKSNERLLKIMGRRSVREHFLPPGEAYCQSESDFLDIYGLGKTIQYLLSVSEPKPGLTRGETARFQRIISKSLNRFSKRAYVQVSQLRKDIPVYHVQEKRHVKIKVILSLAAAVTAAAAGVTVYRNMAKAAVFPEETEELQEKTKENIAESKDRKKANELERELGFLYFLEKQDYEAAGKYFSEMQGDKAAAGLADLSEYMQVDISGREKELLEILQEIERAVPVKESEKYNLCLIEGYRLLDSREAAENVIRLCKICEKAADENTKRKLTAYMANGCEKTGEKDKAAEKYLDMLTWTSDAAAREEIYKRLIFLYQETGKADEAASICRQGVEELKGSKELRIMHMGIQCADGGIEREVCAQTVRGYIEEIPEIVEDEDFKKLAREYGIVVEGENIWVGR